jgi:hypothetical protein
MTAPPNGGTTASMWERHFQVRIECLYIYFLSSLVLTDCLEEFKKLGYGARDQAWYIVCPSCSHDGQRIDFFNELHGYLDEEDVEVVESVESVALSDSVEDSDMEGSEDSDASEDSMDLDNYFYDIFSKQHDVAQAIMEEIRKTRRESTSARRFRHKLVARQASSTPVSNNSRSPTPFIKSSRSPTPIIKKSRPSTPIAMKSRLGTPAGRESKSRSTRKVSEYSEESRVSERSEASEAMAVD